ncbi:MAG TPA: inositol-3-phosphate synthase [Candidatus Bathyarchaeia archaeon]|nr:MAG: inositol-3-phosphate synthase [Candidatus Bathyarchaeota archaeon RBG_16_48_13]HJX22914.1 inositol-3-phosphate synthase [Candidatus Bathyarchaeia archaeon]
MAKIKIALVGVGNCASALIQGAQYYRNASEEEFVPGLLRANFGGYRPRDLEFVAAFDVNADKVGKDLGEAIFTSPNNTVKYSSVPLLGVEVKKGPVMDGLGKYLKPVVKVDKSQEPVDVSKVLKDSGAELLVNYLPVGSEAATKWYATRAIEAGCALVNCMPSFIASIPAWQKKFDRAGLPVAGDDVMSQIGATVLHKTMVKLLVDRGVKVEESYQLNIGGDTDFLNMIEEERLVSKRESKTSAVRAMVPYPIPLRIGPSDYVDFLENKKICYINIKGRYFGNTPVIIDAKLDVIDSPNSAGIVIDAVRATKIALDREIKGPLLSISAFAFKHPPQQLPYDIAKRWVEEFIEGERER